MLREVLGLVVGGTWIGVTWYWTFTGGPNFGPYSLIVAPVVAGWIAGRTTSGLVVGFLPNFLLGVAIGVIILRDLSHVSPGSLESVFGLFGLLGAAILALVGGLVGAVGGAFGGFLGGRLTRRPRAMHPPMPYIVQPVSSIVQTTPSNVQSAPVPPVSSNVRPGSTKACPKCLSVWTLETKFCSNCGSNL